jgi:hypothetical protein
MNVILSGLRPVPINRWTVLPYCSRWIVITLASLSHLRLLASRMYKCNINIVDVYSCLWNENINNLLIHNHYLYSFVFHVLLFMFVHWDDEDMPFMTFVWWPLYPKGDNASKVEGLKLLTIVLSYSWCIAFENKDQQGPLGVPPRVVHTPNLYFISSHHHIRVWVLLRLFIKQYRRSSFC